MVKISYAYPRLYFDSLITQLKDNWFSFHFLIFEITKTNILNFLDLDLIFHYTEFKTNLYYEKKIFISHICFYKHQQLQFGNFYLILNVERNKIILTAIKHDAIYIFTLLLALCWFVCMFCNFLWAQFMANGVALV